MFCSRKMNNKINHIHEKALRLVYDDYVTSFKELLIRDKSVTVHQRNIQNVAIEMFKVKNDLCPDMIKDIFCQKETGNRSNASFQRPNVKSVYKGGQSLRSFGPIVWDTMVPTNLKSITDFAKFKKYIKDWVPNNCTCRLCQDYVSNLGFVTLFE